MFAASACTGLVPAKTAGVSATITITAEPVALNPADPAQQTVGNLRYMGGLVLRSDDARFGGLSGLRWQPDHGRLLAVSDQGNWMQIVPLERDMRLAGIGEVRFGPLNGTDGKPLAGKANADAEGVTLFGDNEILISFERQHRISSFALDRTGAPRGNEKADSNWLNDFPKMPENGGLEAIASRSQKTAGDPGRVIFMSEDLRDDKGLVVARSYRTNDDFALAGAHGLSIAEPYKPTDADFADDLLLILARSYSPLQGVGARLFSSPISGWDQPPAVLHLIAELRPPLTVDNMEGLAVRVEGDRTFLYIVSDDNFSPLQRTLLMKFELLE